MKELVLVIGTLDTKGPEVAYVRDKLKEFGLTPYVIDVGILGEPIGITPDFSKAELAQYGGTTIEKVQNAGSRGAAVELMREFVVKKVTEMVANKEVIGAIGLGCRRWCDDCCGINGLTNWSTKNCNLPYCIR